MSILTDRQIRIRCQWQGKKIVSDSSLTTVYMDPRAAERELLTVQSAFRHSNTAFTLSDATAEEGDFTPMITPFHPAQIRTIQRDPTRAEARLFHPQEMLTQEEQMAELKRLSPSALGVSYVDHGLGHQSVKIDQKIVSSGLSSMGYDVTLARDFKIFTNVNNQIIDPLAMSDAIYHVNEDVDYCVIPPNSYILGHTVEWFDIPKNILALCLGKSTYARCGAIVNATPIEPGFKGRVVIEISNATNLPLKVYAGQGVAQFLFLQSSEDCEVGYGDRDGGKGGKYQGQEGLQTALV